MLAEGGRSAQPEVMAHNKIPPRWLNCPRRGQPVAGNRTEGLRVPRTGGFWRFRCLRAR